MKEICIVSPCYNEESNIEELFARVQKGCGNLTNYSFTFLFIDNASKDGTVKKLRKLAINDKRIKIIINTRNFGHIRSPYYGILQSNGDATIYLASDLQDPPELIPKFLEEWENGFKVVLAEKNNSNEGKLTYGLRKIYYKILNEISDINLTSNTTGFGLYDKVVLDEIRKINDPYPYLRGMICEIGHEIKLIKFQQPERIYGVTKNNIFTLYDIGILGVISHSLFPIRLATFVGILMVLISILSIIGIILYKIFFLISFSFFHTLILLMIFGLFGLIFLFIGMLGEYIGSIHTYLQNRPIVVEKERINFSNNE